MITVYVLQGQTRRYIGITNDLPRRLAEHKTRQTKASHILGRFYVLHTEAYPDHKSARP